MVEGRVVLPVTVGEESDRGEIGKGKIMTVEFIVVKVSTAYNAIIGRPILSEFCVIVCIRYLCMKMPSEAGPITKTT